MKHLDRCSVYLSSFLLFFASHATAAFILIPVEWVTPTYIYAYTCACTVISKRVRLRDHILLELNILCKGTHITSHEKYIDSMLLEPHHYF